MSSSIYFDDISEVVLVHICECMCVTKIMMMAVMIRGGKSSKMAAHFQQTMKNNRC